MTKLRAKPDIRLDDALQLYEMVAVRLFPFCSKLSPVGSMRRQKTIVHDLDILCKPHGYKRRGTWWEIDRIREEMKRMGSWVKGGERMMTVKDLFGRRGVWLDLFLCHPPAQWSSLLALRTGPDNLAIHAKDMMKAHGVEHKHGAPLVSGKPIVVDSERDWFELAQVEFVAPHRRESLARRLDLPPARPVS
jgi:DNA polymerase/3'-5' exonuclease PolX